MVGNLVLVLNLATYHDPCTQNLHKSIAYGIIIAGHVVFVRWTARPTDRRIDPVFPHVRTLQLCTDFFQKKNVNRVPKRTDFLAESLTEVQAKTLYV